MASTVLDDLRELRHRTGTFLPEPGPGGGGHASLGVLHLNELVLEPFIGVEQCLSLNYQFVNCTDEVFFIGKLLFDYHTWTCVTWSVGFRCSLANNGASAVMKCHRRVLRE